MNYELKMAQNWFTDLFKHIFLWPVINGYSCYSNSGVLLILIIKKLKVEMCSLFLLTAVTLGHNRDTSCVTCFKVFCVMTHL